MLQMLRKLQKLEKLQKVANVDNMLQMCCNMLQNVTIVANAAKVAQQ